MKPSANRLLNDPVASVESRISRLAIGVGRVAHGPLQRLLGRALQRLKQQAQARRLQSLDDHMLRDIGLSPRDVGWCRVGTAGDPQWQPSYELYFRARETRAKAMGDVLKWILANAWRQVRRRARTRHDEAAAP
jgi:uncharacterized protein YjiS (DUF1127 family)